LETFRGRTGAKTNTRGPSVKGERSSDTPLNLLVEKVKYQRERRKPDE